MNAAACYVAGLLLGVAFVFSPVQVNAQDTIPKSNNATTRLKQSLDQVVTDADQAKALLQTAKELNYLPGQVVALCQLAGIYDGEQAAESAKNLQEAQRLAGQVRDFLGASWALRKVSKLQRYYPSKSRELKKGLSDVLGALGQAMGNSKMDFHLKPVASTNVSIPGLDSNDASAMKIAKKYMQDVKKGLAKIPRTTDINFSDKWLDSFVDMGNQSRKSAKKLLAQKASRDSIKALSNSFAKKGNYAEAYKSFLAYTNYKDSLTAEVSSRRLAQLQYNQQLQKKEAEIKLLNKDRQLKEQAANRQLFYMIALFGCIAALSAILLILNRNNRAKKRANQQLNTQKDELQRALTELKTTQTQLVHSEKMASLGELTAGIAHEIQNPLNFVNNFSEVSAELIQELIENLRKPEVDRELDMELLNDVDENLRKVSMHGKRASAIVKSMLEHSRADSGEKKETDLDALVDEYLKLAYHGMRARDKSFEAKIVTGLHSGPKAINIVPQEIGRVLLNIVNNAFYAVQQRQKESREGYEPTVTIPTNRKDNEVTIKIRDNGAGMPEHIRQKVFQPFFTTKPTGEGTGLGLSLSYDIITKGHNGKLVVTSEANRFTEFMIVLPG